METAYLNATLSIIAAGIYSAVGNVVRARPVSQDAMLARRAFTTWWYAVAAVTAAGALTTIVGAYEAWTLSALVTYTQVVLLLIVLALGGLFYYFYYLFTGQRNSWTWILGAYAAYAISILYYIAASQPIGLEPAPQGGQQLAYANDLSESTFAAILGALLLLPVLGGAIGYISLIRKVEGRSAKFRLASVAGAFIFWFGTSFLAGQVDVDTRPWWPWVSQGIAVLSASVVYAAFNPPKWLAAWLGVEGYSSAPDEAK